MEFVYDDGGRSKYFKGETRDCVVRAIAIATGKDYKEVYDYIYKYTGKSPRTGVSKKNTRKILKHYGFEWVPTMLVGQGCKVHLCKEELPRGTIIVSVSKHIVCVKDGVVYDTRDCSRNGRRCVYGYFTKGGETR